MGAGTIDLRIVLGSLIIKHHEELSDDGAIENTKENIYMQYFLGLPSIKRDAVFSPTLFVEIRKHLGLGYWQEINEIIIKYDTLKKKSNSEQNNRDNQTRSSNDEQTQSLVQEPSNNGTINLEASIVEQDIQYPIDLGILNESREKF